MLTRYTPGFARFSPPRPPAGPGSAFRRGSAADSRVPTPFSGGPVTPPRGGALGRVRRSMVRSLPRKWFRRGREGRAMVGQRLGRWRGEAGHNEAGAVVRRGLRRRVPTRSLRPWARRGCSDAGKRAPLWASRPFTSMPRPGILGGRRPCGPPGAARGAPGFLTPCPLAASL